MSVGFKYEVKVEENGKNKFYKSSMPEDNILTVVRGLSEDGKETELLAQFQPGQNIDLNIGQMLSSVHVSLDDTNLGALADYRPGNDFRPPLRLTGMEVGIDLKCKNHHEYTQADIADIKDADAGENPWDGSILCVVGLSAQISAWSTKTVNDFSALSAIDNGEGTYRTRSYSGIKFRFTSSGRFGYFDPGQLVNSLVNAVVLFSLPATIMGAVALYGIGRVSQIYKQAAEYSSVANVGSKN